VTLLTLEGVAKQFTRGQEVVVALDGVDLEVSAGEFVAVVGRSGSGKSTLLHVAGGLDTPDAGRVVFDGRDVHAMSVSERAALRRRDIGFVFQFFHLIPTLTVAENVRLPLMLDGGRSLRDAPDEVLERVALLHRRDHLPGELSGGEMQRAAIARALVARPRLILADEPTGNLDSATGAGVLDVLTSQVADVGAALLMVTHDEDAASRASRVTTLADGRVAHQRRPARRPSKRLPSKPR
jgi:ABC-type lipoprotein export system ATPase subunit